MKSRRTFLAGTSALAAAATPLAGFAQQPFTATATLAAIGPLSGPARRAGEQMVNGARAAIDEANRVRTTFDKALALRTFDDQNEVASAIVNGRFAIDDTSIIGIIGHLGGYTTDSLVRDYAANGVPVIVPASTLDAITSHGYRNVFRLPTKDSSEGDLFAQAIIAQQGGKPKSAHVLVQDGDYGTNVARAFYQRVGSNGIDVKMSVFPWEHPDFARVAETVVATKPEYVFLAGTATDMGGVVPALRVAGYAGPLGASQGFFDALTLTKFAKEAEGLMVSSSMPPLALVPEAFQIQSEYEHRYGSLTPVAAFAYAATQIYIKIIRRSGAAVRNAVLSSLQTPIPSDTIVGSFTFSATGDPTDPNLYFYTAKDGRWSYQRAAHPASFLIK